MGGTEIAQETSDYAVRCPKMVLVSWPLAPSDVPDILISNRIYPFDEYAWAIRVAARLAEHAKQDRTQRKHLSSTEVSFDWSRLVPNPAPGTVVTEEICHRALRAADLETAEGYMTSSEDQAIELVKVLGWPVVLKGISSSVTHRHAAGLVRLGLSSVKELRAAYRGLHVRAQQLGFILEGVYLQRMEVEGAELLLSAFRDPTFGVIVSCGAGGVMAEVLEDISLARAPIDEETALSLLNELRVVRRVLEVDGSRDLGELARFVSRFSHIAAAAPWQTFVLEVNPIKWGNSRTVAVDGLLIIGDPRSVLDDNSS